MNCEELARFMKFVRKRHDGCWEWIGGRSGKSSTSDGGYGVFKLHGKSQGAHVVMFKHHKRLPKGKIVCHTCDRRWCVRPAHLFAGTYVDNTQDSIRKGRMWQLHDKELHRQIGIKMRGRPAPNRGVSPSAITRRKLSRALRGQKRTLEQRLNYSAAAKKREALFKRQGRVRTRNSKGMFA